MLRKEHTSKLKTGSQKAFFARVWDRLHSEGCDIPAAPGHRKVGESLEEISTQISVPSQMPPMPNTDSASPDAQVFNGGVFSNVSSPNNSFGSMSPPITPGQSLQESNDGLGSPQHSSLDSPPNSSHKYQMSPLAISGPPSNAEKSRENSKHSPNATNLKVTYV